MKLFVSPPSATTWKISSDDLSNQIATRFAPVTTEQVGGEGGPVLEWTWASPDGPVDGRLDRDLNCIVLEGELGRCAEVAVWFRGLVPVEQPLVVYDEAYSADLALNVDTLPSTIVQKFEA